MVSTDELCMLKLVNAFAENSNNTSECDWIFKTAKYFAHGND